MTEQPTPDLDGDELAADASIVDTILDLDELLSAQVRRAEKTVPIYTRGDLEGRIDALDDELLSLVDETGRPYPDRAVGERNPAAVSAEIEQLRAEYATSKVNITVRQMASDDWDEFRNTHAEAMKKVGTSEELGNEFWDALVAATMVAKNVTVEKVSAMRTRFGSPQVDMIAKAAWYVCTQAGIAVPFSLSSSLVMQQQRRETS